MDVDRPDPVDDDPGLSQNWREEGYLAEALGLDLRAARAVESGIAPDQAAALLSRIGALERHEYHRAPRLRLSAARRAELWRLRGEIAAAPVITDDLSPIQRSYWDWLFAQDDAEGDHSGPRRGWLRADLARAIGHDPSVTAMALSAWREHAVNELAGDTGSNSALAELERLLDDAVRWPRSTPTPRSFDVAAELADIGGLPPALIELHRHARRTEAAILRATLEYEDRRAALATSLATFRDPGAAPATLGRGRPTVTTDADGREVLDLDPTVARLLDGEIAWRALIEAVGALRLGHAPRRQVLHKKAVGVWHELRHQRRDEAGDPIVGSARTAAMLGRLRAERDSDRVPGPGSGGLTEPGSAERARAWLRAELDGAAAAVEFALSVRGQSAAFPTRTYGARLAPDLGLDHLVAASNCLLALTSAATVDGERADLHARRSPASEFRAHMAQTAPDRWGRSDAGRQLRHSSLAAVAYGAWLFLRDCEFDPATGADPQATAIWGRLRGFTAVALTVGVVLVLDRYLFTTHALRKAADQQTEIWLDRVAAALQLIVTVHDELEGAVLEADERADLETTVAGLLDKLALFRQNGHNNELSADRAGVLALHARLRAADHSPGRA